MAVKKIALTITVLAVSVFLIYTLFANRNTSSGVCEGVVISIDKESQILNEKNILKILSNHKLTPNNRPLKDVKLHKIRSIIESIPSVKTAECYLTKKNNLNIDITQRKAIFKIFGRKKGYVDADREIIYTDDVIDDYLLVASGSISDSLAKNELFDLIEFISNDKLLSNLTQQVYVQDNNIVEIIPTVGDHTILLGKILEVNGKYNFEKRLGRLKAFYESKALNRLDWNAYSTIDLRFDKQVVCKKR